MKYIWISAIIFLLLQIISCSGCSSYATKEACWNSCACCWGPAGEYYITYQCQWMCGGDSHADHKNPSTYCVAVNTVASFAIATALIFASLVAIMLVIDVIVAFVFGTGWIWDQIGDRIKRHIGRRFMIGVGVVAVIAVASAVAAVAYPVAGVLLA